MNLWRGVEATRLFPWLRNGRKKLCAVNQIRFVLFDLSNWFLGCSLIEAIIYICIHTHKLVCACVRARAKTEATFFDFHCSLWTRSLPSSIKTLFPVFRPFRSKAMLRYLFLLCSSVVTTVFTNIIASLSVDSIKESMIWNFKIEILICNPEYPIQLEFNNAESIILVIF